jgi:radical SAM-linked protein
MLPESPLGAPGGSPPVQGEAPGRFKYRLRFRKAGDLRLVSHHDLMHCFERMFRRAALPVPRTQGFNPRPRMWFALSLALGIVGDNEVLEIELTEPLAAEEVLTRLAAQAPPGISFLSSRSIDVRAGAHVRRAFYRLEIDVPPADLAARCAAVLAQPHIWAERQRPKPRRLDVRPFISELTPGTAGLSMALWITDNGAARPEEIISALGLGDDLPDGATIVRTDLELDDEISAEARQAGVPVLAACSEPLATADSAPGTEELESKRPTALMPGPLSFES